MQSFNLKLFWMFSDLFCGAHARARALTRTNLTPGPQQWSLGESRKRQKAAKAFHSDEHQVQRSNANPN